MKFDVVVGNPPYQEEALGKETKNGQKRVTSIFPYFQALADQVANYQSCLIYPGRRWIHQSGKGMSKFGLAQINDPHLSSLLFFKNANELFNNVDIADGISMVLKDYKKTTSYFHYEYFDNGEHHKIDIELPGKKLITLNPLDEKIVSKIEKVVSEKNFKFLSDSVFSQKLFQIESDFVEKNPEEVEPYENQEFDPNIYVKLFVNDKAGKSGRAKWFLTKRSLIPVNHNLINEYQVVVSSANAGGQKRDNQLAIIDNQSAFGRSRVALKSFKTKVEAENFYKYCKTDLVRFAFFMTDEALTSLAKLVPDLMNYGVNNEYLDFSKDLNPQLNSLFELTESEVRYIHNRILTRKYLNKN